jgi:hypothetical protein
VVEIKDPMLNSWRVITGPITITDVKKVIGLIMWDTRKREVKDSE